MDRKSLRRTLLLSSSIAVAGLAGYGRPAFADCVETSPGSAVYLCSDPTTTTQPIDADNATVSTLPGFSIDTTGTGGNAIEITGDGDLSFTDAYQSSITGKTRGIRVTGGADGGSITIDVTGTVNGVEDDGIETFNTSDTATDLTVTTGEGSSVTGGGWGIFARNVGTGALEVTANGDVKGTGFDGISAQNYGSNSTNLTVKTGTGSVVTGRNNGIFARNLGKGALEVSVEGDVSGGNTSHGIYTFLSANGTDLTVKTGTGSTVTGGEDGIRALNNSLTGNLSVTAKGEVRGSAFDGIYAKLGSTSDPTGNLSVTTDAGSYVYGFRDGIDARNAGRGATQIVVNGDVTGKNQFGLYVGNANSNATGSMDVTIGAGTTITGYSRGIRTRNNSSGNQTVTVNGNVYSNGQYGGAAIYLRNTNDFVASDLTLTTAAGTRVKGVTDGINASSFGRGSVIVEAGGDVTGLAEDGIEARILKGNGGADPNIGDLRITTDEGSRIIGALNGIQAANDDSGDLVITANGYVRGNGYGVGNYGGIFAIARGDAALKITTGAISLVKGERHGIFARSYNSTGMTIDVGGRVSSMGGAGIRADMEDPDGSGDVMVTARAQSDVTGQYEGMRVSSNALTGDINVRSGGSVTGTKNEGISVRLQTSVSTGDVTVTTDEGSTTTGGKTGIFANNTGLGALNVVVDGSVVGQTYDGISASLGNANTAGMSITTGAGSSVWGQENGINAFTNGAGPVDITIGGDVSGDGVAVSAGSAGLITLNITGNVFNSSGLVSDQVISLDRGATATYNSGTISGYVVLSFLDDKVINSGTWRSTGQNDFSGGDNEVNNRASGLVHTGGSAGTSDTTEFIALTRFINAGAFSMVDQSAGDGSTAFDATTLDGDFEGEGGVLAIDVSLGGPGSEADELTVKGNSSGTTFVAVNETQTGFASLNPDGILFATVEGTSSATDFDMLGGYYSSGLYSYDVVYDDTGGDGRFLIKGFAGLHAFEVAAVVSGSQNIFFDTTASWAERQNQLRDWNARRGVVVAVADPPVAEDVSETGLWLSLRGTTAERDAEADWNALGKSYAFDTGYDQTTWSLTGGADFGMSMGEGSLLFGVLAGYFNSAQDLNASDTEIDYEGGSLGAYATFLSNGFFASLLAKADLMGIDYSPAGGPEESTNGTNLGLRADAGYRFSLGAAYLEPVASLAAVWTSIDDFALYNSTAEPGTNDAVQLGGGARFGWETASLDLSLTGRVWDAMGGDNEVGLVVPGTGLDTVTDAGFDGVFGEVSGQAAYRLTERVAANLSASYLFNEDQTALSGAAGVSVSW